MHTRMDKKTLIAAKVSTSYRDECHLAADKLGTSVSQLILAAMRRAIKRAEKAGKE